MIYKSNHSVKQVIFSDEHFERTFLHIKLVLFFFQTLYHYSASQSTDD